MKQVWLLAAAATVFAVSAGSEIHRWVDKDGNVHYSDSPPSHATTEKIEPPPPPSKENIRRTQARTDLLIEQQRASADQRAQEREEKRLQIAEAEQQAADRKRLCIGAKGDLYVLRMPRPVFTIDEKGERVFADDELRQSEIEEMKSIIAANCK